MRSFSSDGLAKVDQIARIFSIMAENYRKAYGSHQRVVEADNQAVESAESVRDAILGVVIGVASAYTCVPLLEAFKLTKVLVETGGELAELGISKTVDAASPPSSKSEPDGLTPDAMELEQTKSLVDLYRKLAELQTGADVAGIALAAKDVIIDIERYDDGRNKFSATKLDRFTAGLVEKEPLAKQLDAKIAEAKADIEKKLLNVQSTGALSGPRDLLEDIWTRWLANGGQPGLRYIYNELRELGLIDSEGRLGDLDFKGHNAPDAAAARALRGKAGVASTDLAPEGHVEVEGGSWGAVAVGAAVISAGSPIRVVGVYRAVGQAPEDTTQTVESTNTPPLLSVVEEGAQRTDVPED